MSKVFACLCALMLVVSVGATADELVSFVAVDSQAGSGMVTYNATVTGGFTMGDFDWAGFASTINAGTYASELTLDVSGPLGAATITLGSGTTYAPGAAFSGTSAAFTGGDPAGTWTFDFYETYDDGGDGLPDATWDTIDFNFVEFVVVTGEVVPFLNVPSQAGAGMVTYNATVVGGFTLESIDWLGFASTINAGTYGSELTMDISGPLGSATITLGSGTTYAPGATFSGSDVGFAGGDPAGTWTFDFYETYDDGGDGLPDANWDNIDFTFVEAPPSCNDDLVDLGAMDCVDTLYASGDTTGATDWCGNASGDAHFSFTANEAGDYTISLCNGATVFDTYLRLYDDACCGNQIAYNDDSCGVVSELTTALTAGTYYVHVEGYSSNEGYFDLDITCSGGTPPCVGPDNCANAQLITAGIVSGDTTNCTDTFPSYSLWGWGLAGNDHVYSIDVPCAGTEVCVTFTPGSGQDGAIALSNACVDGPVTAVAGADDTLGGEVEAFCYITSTADAATMYIYVDSYGAGSAGAYDLEVAITTPVTNDTCATAVDVSAGGTFSGSNECAANDYDVLSDCIEYATGGADVVYAITVNDGDTVDLVLTPLSTWDPALYVVSDCGDAAGTCLGGADAGLNGDPEYATLTFACAGTYYIMADSWYGTPTYGEGDFDLDVVITPAVPVDTFDVEMLCTPSVVTLPAMVNIKVRVTNTSAVARMVCGNVGVTLCNGSHISNVRAGSMTLAAGANQILGWGQNILPYPTTCGCTLVFDTQAYDCTPCADTAGVPAGWTESTSGGVTTVCP